nr:hypothetical protein [Tanacetum cinerariifolium]
MRIFDSHCIRYDGLPMMPEDPYAYVEAAMQEPPPPDFFLEPVYPEFMPPKDDVLPAEEQPLPVAVSPTTDSPADYLTDRDDDDDEEESSEDDADDEEEDEGEDEEEHLAPANSVPPPIYRTTARISIRAQTPIPFSSKTEVARLLIIPALPPSPLTSYSSPLSQIPSPPPPASPTHPLGYRAAMIRLRVESPSTSRTLPLPPPIVLPYTRASMVMMRAATPSTYILAPRSETPPSKTPPSGTPLLLPIPLPTSSPPLLLPSTDCKADVPRPTGVFRADYGFVGTLDAEIRRDPNREIDFVTTVRQDTDEIYGRLDDAQDDRLLMNGLLNSLRRDRHSHARTTRLMESGARASREAWVQSMDANDTTRLKVRALQTTVLAQQTENGDLRAAARR